MPFLSTLTTQQSHFLDHVASLLNAPTNTDGSSAAEELDNGVQSSEERIPLSSIKAVAAHLPFVDAAHVRITTDMEAMVITGLGTLVSPISQRMNY